MSLSNWLSSCGVEKIYFGSGDRNSLLWDELPEFKKVVGLDERSLAFEALGYLQVRKNPVGICVTSGTAVAECLPALIEAYYSDLPLIIISADRPSILRDSRAPQTINQIDIFKNFIGESWSGPLEKFDVTLSKFPIHINLEINKEKISQSDWPQPDITSALANANKPLAVFTGGSKKFLREYITLKSNGFHIYNEVHSNLKISGTIKYEQTLLKEMHAGSFDLILKFGGTPLTKLWRELNSQFLDIPIYCFGSPYKGLVRGEYIACIPSQWPKYNRIDLLEKDLQTLLKKYSGSEPSVVAKLVSHIPKDDFIFVGNSMPIRYLDFFKETPQFIYCNRGANGIDGQLSTAIGIATQVEQVVHCIVGDLTFLYDSTRLLYEFPKNIKFYVLNNRGGRIFKRTNSQPEMALVHDIDISKNFQKQVEVINIDNEQTERFWSEW